MSRRWRIPQQPRRGRFTAVPPPPIPVPVWIPAYTTPARRATHPAIRRTRYAAAPLGSFGPHETLWRLGTPGSGWQFGTPVIT